MKNFKLILPVLAFICAIGMSFATVESNDEQALDYILRNGTWEAIEELNCQQGPFTCQVQYGENGPIYDVYDEMGDSQPKVSGTPDPVIREPN